jgi:hypothetical protein
VPSLPAEPGPAPAQVGSSGSGGTDPLSPLPPLPSPEVLVSAQLVAKDMLEVLRSTVKSDTIMVRVFRVFKTLKPLLRP